MLAKLFRSVYAKKYIIGTSALSLPLFPQFSISITKEMRVNANFNLILYVILPSMTMATETIYKFRLQGTCFMQKKNIHQKNNHIYMYDRKKDTNNNYGILYIVRLVKGTVSPCNKLISE